MTNVTFLPSSKHGNVEPRSPHETRSDRELVQHIQQELRSFAEQLEAFHNARRKVLGFREHVALGETGSRLIDCADLLSIVTQDGCS